MVGKENERKGKRAIDGHRTNGKLSFIQILWPVILDLQYG
jgi:hypothetical protein